MPNDYSTVNERRHSYRMRTMLGLRGEDANKLVLMSSMPVFELEIDPLARPELLYPGGERQEGVSFFVSAGGVGFVSRIALLNPVGSNVIAVLEWANKNFVADIGIGIGILPLAEFVNYAPVAAALPRDSRQPNTAVTPIQGPIQCATRNNSALTVNEVASLYISSSQNVAVRGAQFVFTPGFGVFIFPITGATGVPVANVAQMFGLAYRWRPADAAETAP